MPILSNPKFELFAQGLAQGRSATEAYELAGYSAHASNASRLSRNDKVQARVAELMRDGAERAGVTIQAIVEELRKLGFSDIRKAIRWKSALVTEQDNPDGGDVLVVRSVVTNLVEIVGSDEIDDATAAAISEISQTDKGAIKIKLHDKRAALVDMGRHLGMFTDKSEVRVTVSQEEALAVLK